MIGNFGFGALVLALVVSIYGVIAALIGVKQNSLQWVESARRAMTLTFPLLTLVAGALILLLATGQFQYVYVYNNSSVSMPLYLKITALWGGQSGSLLFWSWLLAAFATAVTLRKWKRDLEFLSWVIVVSLLTLTFFLIMSVFFENPFTRFWQIGASTEAIAMFKPQNALPILPADGRGLNPLLRHPGMIFHPPMLYLGFVSFVIPFAFGIAALVTGRSDDRWIRVTRRWTLVAWLFLSLGLVLGSRWAYDVLGWGGYWAWDPVEIAAFMPWLSGTAFLHTVMAQEKRGLFKRLNMILIILTYSLVIFGTFLTRSGVLSSVHAFSQSAIGPLFFGYIGITFLVSAWLLITRWNDLKSDAELNSLLSRETVILVATVLFLGVLVVCFWGVIYPLISELVTGTKVTVGPPFYKSATGPLFAGILLLMGIAPLSAWGHSTWKTMGSAVWKPFAFSILVTIAAYFMGAKSFASLLGFWLAAFVVGVTFYETWLAMAARSRKRGVNALQALGELAARNRRRYGGYIIHTGVILMALGIIGIELFQTQTQGTVKPGESITLGHYSVTFDRLDAFDTPDARNVARAVVSVAKDGKPVGELYPRRDFFYDSQQPMTIPGVRTTAEDDLYVILVDWQSMSQEGVTFKVYHNPLVVWLWVGSFVFILGTLVAAWPAKDEDKQIETKRNGVTR